jgi:predicted Zn-dependent protease
MTTDELLTNAIELIKAGRKAEAQRLLQPYIAANPQHVSAWLWEARTRPTTRSRIEVLERCLVYNPGDDETKQALAALYTQVDKRAQ